MGLGFRVLGLWGLGQGQGQGLAQEDSGGGSGEEKAPAGQAGREVAGGGGGPRSAKMIAPLQKKEDEKGGAVGGHDPRVKRRRRKKRRRRPGRRWKGVVEKARGGGVAGPAHHGRPPSKAGHLAGGDEGRPALGSGQEADSGWAVEHGRAASTRRRGGGAELVLEEAQEA